jgi:hypothetical protein
MQLKSVRRVKCGASSSCTSDQADGDCLFGLYCFRDFVAALVILTFALMSFTLNTRTGSLAPQVVAEYSKNIASTFVFVPIVVREVIDGPVSDQNRWSRHSFVVLGR